MSARFERVIGSTSTLFGDGRGRAVRYGVEASGDGPLRHRLHGGAYMYDTKSSQRRHRRDNGDGQLDQG